MTESINEIKAESTLLWLNLSLIRPPEILTLRYPVIKKFLIMENVKPQNSGDQTPLFIAGLEFSFHNS